jgi:hypothetical protein
MVAAFDLYEIESYEDYTLPIIVDTDSAIITNHGTLSGDVTLNTGYTITIQNYGNVSGNFYCGSNCIYITQEISGNGDVRLIPKLSGHVVSAYNDNIHTINMADLINVAINAHEIHLGNGTFNVGTNSPLFPRDIIISDDGVVFVITDISGDLSQPLVSNIVNSNVIMQTRFSSDIDNMFNPSYDWRDGALYVVVVRETNYSVVFGGVLGDYLDSVREKNPDDKLLMALDAAKSRNEMTNILSRSVRTNPINLMNPIISLNSHDLIKYTPGSVITPFYLYSNSFSVVGANINISGKISDTLSGNIGFIGGAINYSDDMDDFSGTLYGGNIGVQSIDDKYYINTYGKFVYARFDDLDVFNDETVIHNPDGFGMDLVSDFGLVYRVYDNVDFIPFVGSRVDYVSVVSENKMDFNLRIGVRAEKSDTSDGNNYAIGGKFIMQTDGAIYGGLYMDMLSVADGVGGGFEVGALYDDMGFSFRFGLNGKIVF